MKYQKLNQAQRYLLEALLKTGQSINSIAEKLGVHRSTIWRERKRNTDQRGQDKGNYIAVKAQKKAVQREKRKPRRMKLTQELIDQIEHFMKEERWSPELIAAYWKRQGIAGVSTERIYRWLYAMKKSNKASDAPYKRLFLYLRHAKRRRKRGNYKGNRGCIQGRQSIDKRPAIVEDRVRFGDFEADLMIGRKTGCPLLVLTDRASLYTKIKKLPGKDATKVVEAIIEMIQKIGPQRVKTITFDNGLEFAKHVRIKKLFGIETYFTRPYSSQEKGTVENRIGVIRRWFSKGESIDEITDQEIQQIENKMNNRGVRKFEYLSPMEKIKSTWGHVALDT